MIILPAIDIKDGNCVRLFKGDFSTVEKVAADYMETAKGFEAAGASWIHMVDLDGAKEGRPVNQHIYEDVAAKTGLKVEMTPALRPNDSDPASVPRVTAQQPPHGKEPAPQYAVSQQGGFGVGGTGGVKPAHSRCQPGNFLISSNQPCQKIPHDFPPSGGANMRRIRCRPFPAR